MIGAVAGYVAAIALEVPAPAWTVAIAGGIVLAVISWLAYRPAIGLTLAILLGAACPVGVIAWGEQRGMNLVNPPAATDENSSETRNNLRDFSTIWSDLEQTWDLLRESEEALDAFRRGGIEEVLSGDDAQEMRESGDAEATSGETPEWRAHLGELISGIVEDVRLRWDAAPEGIRRSVVLSAVCGAVLGFLIGLAAPTLGASVLTALLGAAMMLGGGTMVGHQLGAGADSLPLRPPDGLADHMADRVIERHRCSMDISRRSRR